LGIVDWVNEGRSAMGESWVAKMWKAKNEVWRVGEGEGQSCRKLLLRDNVVLDGAQEGETARRMEGLGVFGTVLLVGPVMEALGTFFVEEFKMLPRIGGRDWGDEVGVEGLGEREVWRRERWKKEKKDGIVWTAARVRGCVVVKFGAREMNGAKKWLGTVLRMEGTVAKEFGKGGLMCVQ
jgi:urease accessory protein